MNFMWRSATWPSVTFYGLNGAKLFKHGDQSFLWMTFSPLWRIISLSSHTYGRKHPHIHKAHTHTQRKAFSHSFLLCWICTCNAATGEWRGNGPCENSTSHTALNMSVHPSVQMKGTRGATIHLSWFNIWLRLRLETHVCVFKWK